MGGLPVVGLGTADADGLLVGFVFVGFAPGLFSESLLSRGVP